MSNDSGPEAEKIMEEASRKQYEESFKEMGQTPPSEEAKLAVNSKEKKIMKAIMETNKGTIEIEFGTATPKTVENFTKLAKEGFYDGVKFHRVIKGFMIQGGDPLTKDDSQMAMWGTGGPGYKFADEITSTNKNDIGTISMANAGPNTNGSQFFINVNANNFLDGKHTVFGKVVKGMDVVTAIENTKTGAGDRPVEPVVIKGITLE
jgi:peptidylprolyl isomerase